MLIASIFLNIVREFYCLHKLLKIKSEKIWRKWVNNFYRKSQSFVSCGSTENFPYLWFYYSHFQTSLLALLFRFLPPEKIRRFLFVDFVWQTLKIFFMTFHSTIFLLCINFHTGENSFWIPPNKTKNRGRAFFSFFFSWNVLSGEIREILDSAFLFPPRKHFFMVNEK